MVEVIIQIAHLTLVEVMTKEDFDVLMRHGIKVVQVTGL